MSERVAAVVVTYNRAALLVECIAALLKQTRPLDKIFIIDNASTDGTSQVLEKTGFLDDPAVVYIRLPVNTGGAGGFSEGMRQAHQAQVDWTWVMDDDAEPDVDALEHLAMHFDRPGIAGVASVPVDRQYQPQAVHRGWLEVCGNTTSTHKVVDVHSIVDAMEISFASFVGLAVPRAAVERIGFPKDEMFIKCDDLEYCIRLAALGPIILASRSLIVHKDEVSSGFSPVTRFGRVSLRVPLNRFWLNYFAVRNLVWLRRQHCGTLPAFSFAATLFLRNAIGILVFDADRAQRLNFYFNAVMDGWKGVFDNQKPRRLTAPRKPLLPASSQMS